jgi:Skp family chaperone for outer membrane proteins
MKKLLTVALLALASTPVLAAPPPAPKVVVLDRVGILQFSKVGRSVAQQLQALNTQTKASFEAQQKSLAAESQQLRQQVAVMAADQRQKKEDAFNAKVRGIEESTQRRATQIQQAGQVAQAAVAQALGPIVEALVKERGANMVLDKQAVVFSNNNAFDITPEAISRLDAKMSNYKVVLGAPMPTAPAAAAQP